MSRTAAIADARRRQRVRRAARARGLVPLPPTVGDCRGPGVCPKFSCRYNLVLRVSDAGSILVGRHDETVVIPVGRTSRGKLSAAEIERRIEEAAKVAVRVCDRLSSTCALDLAEDEDLTPPDDDPATYHQRRTSHLSQRQVAAVLDVEQQAVDREERQALAKLRPRVAAMCEAVAA